MMKGMHNLLMHDSCIFSFLLITLSYKNIMRQSHENNCAYQQILGHVDLISLLGMARIKTQITSYPNYANPPS